MTYLSQNAATETHRGRATVFGHWDRLAEAVRTIFPHKTALNLANISGLQARSWEYFLYRKSSVSSNAIVALLHTDHGFHVLRALMGDARPAWWAALKQAAELEQIKAERDALNKRIADLERQP